MNTNLSIFEKVRKREMTSKEGAAKIMAARQVAKPQAPKGVLPRILFALVTLVLGLLAPSSHRQS